MKLLHPFMPFITEYLYQELSGKELEDTESIMISPFPTKTKRREEEEAKFEIIMDAIVSIRRAKVLVDMANQRIAKAYVKIDGASAEAKEMMKPYIAKLAKVEEIEFCESKIADAVSDIGEKCEVFIPTASIDLAPIISRLEKQSEKLEKEISKLAGMLNNERFVANAPEDAQPFVKVADAVCVRLGNKERFLDELPA